MHKIRILSSTLVKHYIYNEDFSTRKLWALLKYRRCISKIKKNSLQCYKYVQDFFEADFRTEVPLNIHIYC